MNEKTNTPEMKVIEAAREATRAVKCLTGIINVDAEVFRNLHEAITAYDQNIPDAGKGKTKEEIFVQTVTALQNVTMQQVNSAIKYDPDYYKAILKAMQLYADQQTHQIAEQLKAEFTDEWIKGEFYEGDFKEGMKMMRDEILKKLEKI